MYDWIPQKKDIVLRVAPCDVKLMGYNPDHNLLRYLFSLTAVPASTLYQRVRYTAKGVLMYQY